MLQMSIYQNCYLFTKKCITCVEYDPRKQDHLLPNERFCKTELIESCSSTSRSSSSAPSLSIVWTHWLLPRSLCRGFLTPLLRCFRCTLSFDLFSSLFNLRFSLFTFFRYSSYALPDSSGDYEKTGVFR